MSDKASKKTDKQILKLDKQIDEVYSEAKKDLENKFDTFKKKLSVKMDIKEQEFKDGKITQSEFNNWMKGQIFQGEQWENKVDQVTRTIHNSNKIATNIINKEAINTFIFNGNYEAYSIEHGAGINFGFGLYDKTTVVNLIKNDPQILPEWKIDEKKDYIWNKKKVNNAITQGIIQGEKLDQIADRLTNSLCTQNKNKMKTFARTGMTQAQNAGRYQRQMDAKSMGIDLVKEWMSTLDGRTRDSHRHMDGEQIKVGDKWHPQKFSNGCRYPGDPQGPPQEVYNCRCTLVADLVDFPSEYERYDNIDGKPIKNMTYDEWYKIKYSEKISAEGEIEYEKAKKKLEAIEQKIQDKGADKVFKGIWKDDVTYADWETKKDSIEAKREWYSKNNQKQADNFVNTELEIDHTKYPDLYWRIAEHDSLEDFLNDKSFVNYLTSDVVDKYGYVLDTDDLKDVWTIYKGSSYTKLIQSNMKYLKDLDEFEKYGEQYSKLLKERDAAKKLVKDLKPKPDLNSIFGTEAYTQSRKDAAVWAKSAKEADSVFRQATKDVWKDATSNEKYAAWDYTAGSGKFNRPLRGYDRGWGNSKGVGNVPLDNEGAKSEIHELTELLKRSKLQQDTWVQRGIETMDGLSNFVGIPKDVLRKSSQEELEQLLIGKEISDAGFMSCGSAKGKGFSGSILNIYCPEGTQAIYCEPFSAFGHGGKKDWDGISDQDYFGGELETLLQRNSKFVVTKVEKVHDKIYLDIDVINQDPDAITYIKGR